MSDNNQNIKLEMALKYASLGWSILPIGAGEDGKAPLISTWVQYQKERPSEDLIRSWWGKWPNANIAVVTGRLSGISVVDIDCKKDQVTGEIIKTGVNEGLTPTLMARSGGLGWHYFYKYQDGLASKIGFRELVDLKSDGGYIILPPSDHKSGNRYEWHSNLDKELIAPFPEEIWLELSQAKKPKSQLPVVTTSPAPIITPEIPMGTRNGAFASIVGKLVSHLPVTDWESWAKPLIFMANAGNKDPLPGAELLSVYSSITQRELAKRTSSPTKSKIEVLSAKELEDTIFPEANWAIYGIFETGTVNMISAEPNNFKSWVMLDAAVSLASGRPLFGQFKTEKQSVLIVNEEDYHSQLRTRMMMLYKNWSQLPIYFAIQNGVKLIDSDVEKIISLAKEKGVDFIIFDSLRSLHSAEENSSTEMQAVLDQLKKVTKAGFTVLFSHHNRKKGISSSDNGNESRGSSGINAAVHGHITCEPKEEGGQTFLIISQPKLKGGPKMDPFRVRIDLSSDKPFVYDGAYSKGLSKNELEEEIIKLLEFHDGKGLDIGHFLAANLAGDRRLRETLRVMAGDKRVNPILWKDVQKSGLPVVGEGSNPNEKFYFLPDSLINDDIPP
jgi:hypothetical protein